MKSNSQSTKCWKIKLKKTIKKNTKKILSQSAKFVIQVVIQVMRPVSGYQGWVFCINLQKKKRAQSYFPLSSMIFSQTLKPSIVFG